MRAFAIFLAATVAIVLVGGWAISLAWPSAEAAQAIRISGIVAVVVQLLAFAIMRLVGRRNAIGAWGVGSVLRFATLIGYALLFSKGLGAAQMPALLSLALFLFLSSLVEPLLLNV